MPIQPNDIQRELRTMHQQLDDAQFLADRALGLTPRVVLGEQVRVTAQAREPLSIPDMVFSITEVVGTGRDAMTVLRAPNGARYKWFRATELSRAAGRRDEPQGDPGEQLLSLARRIVADSHGKTSLGDAVKRVSVQHLDLSERYRERFSGSATKSAGDEQTVVSLRHTATEPFTELVERVAREHGVDYRRAVQLTSRLYRDLATAHERG